MNALLHCLANRSRPFTTSPTDPSNFSPATLPDDELKLRQQLCLDLPVDYYLRSYMANLYSWPDIWQNLVGARDEDFDPLEIPRPKVISEGCELLASEGGVAVYEEFNLVQRMPVPFDWSLRWQNEGNGIIRDELSGQQSTVRVKPSTEVLRVSWPSWAPFAGPLRILDPWLEGVRYSFHVEPAMFPWPVAVKRIEGDPALSQMLAVAGLVDEFHGSSNPRLKLAIATAVLIANHPSYRRA